MVGVINNPVTGLDKNKISSDWKMFEQKVKGSSAESRSSEAKMSPFLA